jgi:uncharacterized protein (TIGR03435 family)
MNRKAFYSVSIALVVSILHAQAPEFEAASIKANHSEGQPGGMRVTKGSLMIVNAPLQKIIAAAFGIGEDRDAYLLAGPDWINAEHYDISASFPAGTTPDQMRLMLEALLTMRLHMSFHRETRGVSAYALVQDKGGLKAQRAAAGAPTGYRRNPGHLETESSTISLLADKLSQQSDRPVVDATGLEGAYAFKLEWQPDDLNNESNRASLFTAIQDQLGLKLESRKEPMEVVVIDHIEKVPTEN